jgi:very-short-patch-repair endonuclease
MEKCKYCEFETDNKIKFAKHVLHEHKQNRQTYLIQTEFNGVHPQCSCGCGTLMKYNPTLGTFPKYIKKHLKVILKDKTFEEIWGDPKSPKRIKAISDSRKKKFTSGEYDHIKEAVKLNRKDPTLGNKISKGAKGIPKPKPEGFGTGRIHSEETKEKMSDSAIERIIITDQNHSSKLEKTFKLFLDILDIKYKQFLYAKPIKAFYDFYLPEFNMIIEVDGDFWHCNPNKHPFPLYDSQKKNLERDQIKNQWAIENGYRILRFWENDINNNIQEVKRILLEEIEKTIN